MSRVHDALKKAEQAGLLTGGDSTPGQRAAAVVAKPLPLDGLLDQVEEIEFRPQPESHLLTLSGRHSGEGPVEEFRTLRTRMNHLQTLQPIHSVVVTSPSPAEGKSFWRLSRRSWSIT